MYSYNENGSFASLSTELSTNHPSNPSSIFSANSREIEHREYDGLSCYEYCSQDYPVVSHEDPGAFDYNVSYSAIPVGYNFVRGPNIYASEIAGTTYFIQDSIAVPVFSHEDRSFDDYQVSPFSAAPIEYTFVRGTNIYSSEVAGTTYYIQNAIAVPVFSSTESLEPSHLSDVSLPLPPMRSDVLNHENIESSNSAIRNSKCNETVELPKELKSSVKPKTVAYLKKNETTKIEVKSRKTKVKQIEEHTCSVKTEVVCISELKAEAKRLERYKCSVETDESLIIELNEKVKQKPENDTAQDRKSKENRTYVTYPRQISNSYTPRNAEISDDPVTSVTSNKVCDIKQNILNKRLVKKRVVKVTKLQENKKSVKSNQSCKTESTEIAQQADSVTNYELCNLKVNAKFEKSVQNNLCVRHSENWNSEGSKKSTENKSESTTNIVSNTEIKENFQKNDKYISSVTPLKPCNFEASKTNKKKRKNRKTKVKSCIEHEYSIKSNDVSQEKNNFAKSNEITNTELKKKEQKKEEHSCSVKLHELSNLQEIKPHKKKLNKRKKRVKKSVQYTSPVKNEAPISEINVNLNKTDIQINKCNSEVNEESKNFVEYKMCVKIPEASNLEANKKERKVKKKKAKTTISLENKTVNVEGYCDMLSTNKHLVRKDENKLNSNEADKSENKTDNFEDDSNLNCSNKNLARKNENILSSNETDKVENKTVNFEDDFDFNSINKHLARKDDDKLSSNEADKLENKAGNFEDDSFFNCSNKHVARKDRISVSCDEAAKLENETFSFEADSHLNSSDKLLDRKVEKKLSSNEVDKFLNCNIENSITENYDTNGTIDNFKDTKIKSQYASEGIWKEKKKIKCDSSSSIGTFHSTSTDFVELPDTKEACDDKISKLKESGKNVLACKEKVSTIKTDECPNKECHVPSEESNSGADVPVAVPDLENKDSNMSAASSEVKIDDSCPEIESTPSDEIKAKDMDEENKSEVKRKKKKKRFQKIRKWINSLCCCRKNQPS